SGTLLGSWKASDSTQPQDITTDGTDIWLVDDSKDKVYRYAGAASRRSGSQSSSSSFALDSDNKDSTGIVTDGSTIWVTDQHSKTNQVFVYDLTGRKLGAWQLDAANGTPSGITLNPNGGSDLWVVDRAAAKVFRYVGATTRRSGSQSAADSFALVANDKQ